MNELLQLLIRHYETEQKNLQSLLDDCLLEEDYKYARYYHNNLQILQKNLFNLYSLSDYNHVKKTEQLRILSNIEFARSKNNIDSSFIESKIKNVQAELSRLNELPVFEVEEKHDIESAIINLLERKVAGFKLFILPEENLYLDFSLSASDTVHIEFTPFNALNKYSFHDLVHNSEIESLHHNGFKLSEDGNIIYLDFSLIECSTRSLMIFLSKLFLEILHRQFRETFKLLIY